MGKLPSSPIKNDKHLIEDQCSRNPGVTYIFHTNLEPLHNKDTHLLDPDKPITSRKTSWISMDHHMDNLSPSHHDFYSSEISWQEGDTLIRNMFTPLIKSYPIPKDLEKPVEMRTYDETTNLNNHFEFMNTIFFSGIQKHRLSASCLSSCFRRDQWCGLEAYGPNP